MHPMNARVLRKLEELLALDEEELHGFDIALSHLDGATQEVRDLLARCRKEHEQHIKDLVAALQRYGSNTVQRSGGRRGLFGRLQSLRSRSGTVGALRTLSAREAAMQDAYAELLAERELPAEIATLLRRCRDEERRHIAQIADAVAEKKGEAGVAPGAH